MIEDLRSPEFEPLTSDEAERFVGAGKCVLLTAGYCAQPPYIPKPDWIYDGLIND
jgi:hypothetical protein